MLLKYC